MRAIEVKEFGGPEVLVATELPDPQPADGYVVIDVTSCGVNYADTHQIENSYLSAQRLPFIPGAEVVGLTPEGQRVVGFTATGLGGYASKAVLAAPMAVPVPDSVSDAAALSLLVQGLTAYHLLRTVGHLAAGETVVVNAAAGGVGTLAVQLAKLWGAGRVVGLASSPEKRALAESLGADATVDSNAADLTESVAAASGERGVDIVLEMAGGPAGDALLAALSPFGRFITYGVASRTPMSPIAPASLMPGSKTVSGFWLADCMSPSRLPDMLLRPLRELLELVASGQLAPVAAESFPLERAADAHRALLSRATMGKVILTM